MAEKAEIFKGIKLVVIATGLEPETQYYAMLVHRETGEYICTEIVVPDSTGLAQFVFAYTQTNNLPEGNVTLQIFDVARNDMVGYFKNFGKVIETQLNDDTDVPSHQADDI